MGRLAKILSFSRELINSAKASKVKIDPGGGANITAQHFSAPGDDSHPLVTDYALAHSINRTGGEVVSGYADPLNDPKSAPGDKRIYGRDSAGAAVNEVWLKSDGSAIISNGSGFIELLASGNVNINGLIIDAAGNLSSPGQVAAATSLTVGGKEMSGHTHAQGPDSDSDTQQDTGGPV